MKSKQDIRKQLEAGVAVFLSNGGQITKAETQKQKGKRSAKPKENVVEIEVDFLPKSLQVKYFAE